MTHVSPPTAKVAKPSARKTTTSAPKTPVMRPSRSSFGEAVAEAGEAPGAAAGAAGEAAGEAVPGEVVPGEEALPVLRLVLWLAMASRARGLELDLIAPSAGAVEAISLTGLARAVRLSIGIAWL